MNRVSVIVPIYNVEQYIEKCVRSIISQTYDNIEIILVDDGSPDNSPYIIDQLSSSDSRIRVIHTNNGGVSSARNKGLEIATGEYVMFVDGDDWVENDYVRYFVDLIDKYNCNIGMSLYNYTDDIGMVSDKDYIKNAADIVEWIYTGKLFVAVWNKIYRTSYLKNHNIKFDESLWYGEGMLFNIDCLQHTDSVAIGEKCVYHQVSNPNSAMRAFNVASNLCGIRSLEIQKTHWKIISKRIEKAWNYHRYGFSWQIARGLSLTNQKEQNLELYRECIRDLRKGIYKPLVVDIPMKSKLAYICIAISPRIVLSRERLKYRVQNKNTN